MKEILIATYKREDTYCGHSKINHYHVPVEFRCYVIDNSDEREMGVLVNGKPVGDYYDILEVNYKDAVTYRHHFTDRDKANECFISLMKRFGGFKKN
ncbi:MAG: hypothetical protein IKT98_03905 [Selenomonadaceae bacterium]|nr:hypothetical protein [Selenomonadaceae bacterium]